MPKCGAIGSYAQNQALRAHVWAENGPKTVRTSTKIGLARPEHEIMSEIIYTPRLVQSAYFWPHEPIGTRFGMPQVRLDEQKGHFSPALVCFNLRQNFVFGSRESESDRVSAVFGPFFVQTCARSA